MKYKKSVYRSLVMISQLGIHVMVPTALCVGLGIWIDSVFHTYWVIPLLFLGILAGGRNAYVAAMSIVKQDQADSKKEQDQKRRMKKKVKSGL